VALIGENGAGKTTLVKHFDGLLKPTQGDIWVNGQNTRQHTAAQLARWAGLAFQNPDDQLFQSEVRKEVELGPRNLGFEPERIDRQVRWALDLVGLGDAIDTHPYDLELAQRKLVGIAAILAMDTPIVILDEPTTGQDRVGVDRLGGLVTQLRRSGKTIITITHDMDFVARCFPRVVVLAGGRVLLDGPAEEVFAQPEVLLEAGVTPPPLVQLAQRLGWEETPFTIPAFQTALQKHLSPPESPPSLNG